MNYTAKDLFPEWYKSIDPQLNQDLAEKRITAIQSLIKNDDIKFWLDVIRIAYGSKPKYEANLTKIIDEFHKLDIVFPLMSNENLLRVLSGIMLCFKIENDAYEEDFDICLGIVNFNFLGQYQEHEAPFKTMAQDFLANAGRKVELNGIDESIQELTKTLEELEDEKKHITIENSDHITIIKTVQTLNTERERLAEELNSLWWLIGEYSSFYNDFFSKIGSLSMIIPSAYELYKLTTFSIEIKSAKALLQKVLTLSDKGKVPKETTILDAIDSIKQEDKSALLINSDNVSEFTPCLLALKTAFDIDATVWPDTYAAKSKKADIKTKMASREIAFQFYRELIFISRN